MRRLCCWRGRAAVCFRLDEQCCTACSNVTYRKVDNDATGALSPYTQTVVPSCHKRDQRFISVDSVVPDVNPFEAAFRYSTSYECIHGSSYCSSLRIPGVKCVVMIVLLGNIPCAAIHMALSRLVPKIFLVKSQNLTPESTRGYLMSKLFQLCFGCLKFMISLPPNLPPRLSRADATWSWITLSPTCCGHLLSLGQLHSLP